MTIKKAVDKIKKVFHWIIEDDNSLIVICEAFTIVTVINSYMMVSGTDNPKIGRFAYIHLLIRLAIVSVCVVIWDYESVFQAIKKTLTTLKNIKCISKSGIKKIYQNVLAHKFASICIVYTLSIVMICLVMIFSSGIYVPKGGEGLYFNLLLLFAFISITVFFIYISERIKSLFRRNRKL
ncbi:MAG: hypothetical protein MJB12_08460 [Firmicutes bacterium]|nr:hypothetical protein [Bacillota bacterium]